MQITIRKAEEKDIPRIIDLLYQVYNVHSSIRPDLFPGKGEGAKKYNEAELRGIIADKERPIFAAADENDVLMGYAFCVFQRGKDYTSLYIDDLCVDEKARQSHIGRALYEYVTDFAKNNGCYNITLNVWEGNDSALAFYRKMGLAPLKTTMERVL